MNERNLDAEQHRLLTARGDIDMSSDLRGQLEAALRAWIVTQRAVDRLWDLHAKPKGAV